MLKHDLLKRDLAMNRLIACAAALAFATFGTSAAAQCATPDGVNALATEIAAGLNSSRRANGLNQLAFDRKLSIAAQGHACDMTQNDFFSHVGSDGSDVKARTRAAGHDDCFVGENIAWGFPRASQIVDGWMNSPGHRQNMLLQGVTKFGIGITKGAGSKGPNWVLLVARDC